MQNTAPNTPNIREMRQFYKSGHLAKAIAFAKLSVWVKNKKMPKTCEKSFYRNNRVFLCKKPLQEHQIFQKSDNFENRHNAKGIAHAKAIAFPNGQVGSKIENTKNMRKTILQEH